MRTFLGCLAMFVVTAGLSVMATGKTAHAKVPDKFKDQADGEFNIMTGKKTAAVNKMNPVLGDINSLQIFINSVQAEYNTKKGGMNAGDKTLVEGYIAAANGKVTDALADYQNRANDNAVFYFGLGNDNWTAGQQSYQVPNYPLATTKWVSAGDDYDTVCARCDSAEANVTAGYSAADGALSILEGYP